MSEATQTAEAAPTTAGAMLRRARQAQGLHIAALAAAIKVVPRKLELLETDQFDQLPDATFTRALAQSVCRTLKIDPAPVLALLPPPLGQHRLEQVAEGLKTPFNERPGRLVPKEWAHVTSPTLWFAALLLIAALLVYVMPEGWLPFPQAAVTRTPGVQSAPAVATPTAVEPVFVPAPLEVTPAASAPPATTAAAPVATAPPAAEAVPAAGSVLQLRATAPSWIEVVDAGGRPLLSRLVQPGEDVGLDGVMPLKLRIGNASGTEVVFRGQPLELAAFTQGNVARLELK